MPSTDSWQEKPFAVVDHIFANHGGDGSVKAVLNEFRSKIDRITALSAIPSLNDCAIHELLPDSLVRFRCMIQDSYENEIFLQNCTLVNRKTEQRIQKTSYFRDVIDCPNDFKIEHNPAEYGMRQVLYCVSIPAECNWTKKGWRDVGTTKLNCNKFAISKTCKRKRDDNDEMEVASADETSTQDSMEQSKRTKRSNEYEGSHRTPEVMFDKNHPLPGESGPVCLVKIYDESANFKVNDVYEFYGILSLDPTLSNVYDTNDDGQEMDAADLEETKAHHPPASLVPRLHVVFMKKLHHINPHVVDDSPQLSQDTLHDIRSSLLEILKKATYGDSLAAEYLLLHLLSRVYSRHSGLTLGKFSLNISGISSGSDYPVVLCNFLKELVTKMHYFPMSVDTFNSSRFVPTKNYNTNRLDSGLLQLSDGTHLFIDETTLQPGNLTADGVKNIKAVKDLIVSQKIAYNFQFSEVSFESDVGTIVLSEGKSILPCDCQVELKPEIPIPKDTKSYFSSFCSLTPHEILDKCRNYITSTKFMNYELSEETSAAIQETFVAARRQDSRVSADDLHSWLVIARLISISFGCQNLTTQRWDRVKALETQRKARITGTGRTNGH